MREQRLRYRDDIVRAVIGPGPAILTRASNTAALDKFCRGLVELEEAKQLLCANGLGQPNQSLADMIKALLDAPKGNRA